MGRKCYSFNVSPLPDEHGNMVFPTIFSNADYLVPDEIDGIENRYGSRTELRKCDINLSDFSTKQTIIDIPSAHLNEYDWWETMEKNIEKETSQKYYKEKYEIR